MEILLNIPEVFAGIRSIPGNMKRNIGEVFLKEWDREVWNDRIARRIYRENESSVGRRIRSV